MDSSDSSNSPSPPSAPATIPMPAVSTRTAPSPQLSITPPDRKIITPPTSPGRAAADSLSNLSFASDPPSPRHRPLRTPTSPPSSSSNRQSRTSTRYSSHASPSSSPPPPVTRTHSSPPAQPRNRSPFSRPHTRSWSASGASGAPLMSRTKSLPARGTMLATRSTDRPTSASSGRAISPLRFGQEEWPGTTPLSLGTSEISSICEDEEVDFAPRSAMLQTFGPSPILPFAAYQQSGSGYSRRRRPSSPLYHVTSAADPLAGTPSNNAPTSAPAFGTRSSSHSPQLSATRYNETFPPTTYASSMSSSVPSTPTSTRSRSPSISSLETIPDIPDAEQAAIAEDLQDAAARRTRSEAGGANGNSEASRRSSLDNPERGRSSVVGTKGDRKRWSVCGAERRADFGLGTIWED